MTIMTASEAVDLLYSLPPGVKIEINTGAITLTTYTTKDELLKDKYPHLLNQHITLSEAAEKYNLPRGTISSWIYKTGYISPVDPNGHPIFVCEAEIAYLADIYNERRATKSKAPLIDKSTGLPYKIKLPNLAAYRKRRKKGD